MVMSPTRFESIATLLSTSTMQNICPRAWIKWPQVPLMLQCAIVFGVLQWFGVKWALVPPILEQATLILLLLVGVLFRWWPDEEQLEGHLVMIKSWALAVLILWLPVRVVYVGVNEIGSLLDAASLLALLDVALATLVQFAARSSVKSSLEFRQPPRCCMALSESFAGTVWFPCVSPSLLTSRLVVQCAGLASLALWAIICHRLDPVTLFPGQTGAQLLRSLTALCVFTMMLLTALIGFISTSRTLDQQCVVVLAAFPQWHVPWLSAFPRITTAGLWRVQVILVLAAMWSLHLAGASMLSLALVLSARRPTDHVKGSRPRHRPSSSGGTMRRAGQPAGGAPPPTAALYRVNL